MTTETVKLQLDIEYTNVEDGVEWKITDQDGDIIDGEAEDIGEARSEVLSEISSRL